MRFAALALASLPALASSAQEVALSYTAEQALRGKAAYEQTVSHVTART